jgi:circadian clock protein KaiB
VTKKTASKKAVVLLRLYVAGNAPNSVHAIANAKALCMEHPANGYALEIVDLMLHPLRAVSDGIVVTPTLVKLSPRPVLRIIGTLSDTDAVLAALGSK